MTSLEKMLKRLEFEHKNDIRELKGEPLLPIPVELMSEDEYKDFLKSQTVVAKKVEPKKVEAKKEVKPVQKVKVEETKSSTNTVKTEQKTISRVIVNKPTEAKKVEPKVEETKNPEVVKPTESEEKKELKIKPEIVVVEKDEKPKDNMKEVVNILKSKLLNDFNDTSEEKDVEEPKENVIEKNDISAEVKNVKSKILKFVQNVTKTNVTKPYIEDYNRLTSSKKKTAISEMLKSMVTEIAKEGKFDINEILNLSCNINSLANNNNKREYNLMLKSIKEALIKMEQSELIKSLIEKIDKEYDNFIIINKIKFISFIKNSESDLEITKDNLAEVSSIMDSVMSRINNGEDIDKIINSLKDNCVFKKQHAEAKVVDIVDEENGNTEETNNEEIIENDVEPVFLSPEEIDALENTMHEVLMGNL